MELNSKLSIQSAGSHHIEPDAQSETTTTTTSSSGNEKHKLEWSANDISIGYHSPSRSWSTHKRKRQNDAISKHQQRARGQVNQEEVVTKLHENCTKVDQFQDRMSQVEFGFMRSEFGETHCELGKKAAAHEREQQTISSCKAQVYVKSLSNMKPGPEEASPHNCDHAISRRRSAQIGHSPRNQKANPSVILVNCCLLAIVVVAVSIMPITHFVGTAAAAAPDSSLQKLTAQPEPRYTLAAGSMLRIPCKVSNRAGDCAWLGPGGKIITPSKKYLFAKQPSDNDCSIQIKNTSALADDGLWQCQVLPVDFETSDPAPGLQSRLTQLIVLVPPERPQIKDLSQRANRLILEEKKEKNVTCEIRGGNPAPQIEWYLDGKLLVQNVYTSEQKLGGGNGGGGGLSDETQRAPPTARLVQSRLLLNAVGRAMNGKNLTCVGVHQTQNQSASIELDVQYVPSASIAQKEYTLVEGSPLHLACQVDANPPASHVSWRFVNSDTQNAPRSESILTSRTGPVLELAQVSRYYNRARYECLATNPLGISQPAETRLNVLFPPIATNATESGHVTVGSTKQLQCLFDGNPQPEIKWFYLDPLSRTATSVMIDNSKDWQQQQPKTLSDQQLLMIKNVTYRNEGEYHCEARNTINGQTNSVRSSPINLDVLGEPQFLAKVPVYAKAVQGSKSDISLTFCSDPAPKILFWQFGSIRLDVKLQDSQVEQQRVPPSIGHPASRQQLDLVKQQQTLSAKYQVQPLQPLQKRDSIFSKPPTCFEATLSLLDPELNDQRDYSLHVISEHGRGVGVVKVRVTSPLSPALMITSAFLFIFGLFLCSLFFLFVFKKRQHLFMNATGSSSRRTPSSAGSGRSNGQSNGTEGNAQTANGKRRFGRKSDLDGVQQASVAAVMKNGSGNNNNKQTNGLVLGLANGPPNGSANGALDLHQQADDQQQVANSTKGLVHGLMSMASSETSCNDQKQLLASNCSDRNSSVGGGSSNGVTIDLGSPNAGDRHHYHHTTNTSSNSTDRSTANSSPSPMNHISVDDELTLNGTYQATEPVTRGVKLSPMMMAGQGQGQSALIYANIDYAANRQALDDSDGRDDEPMDTGDSYMGQLAGHQAELRRGRQHSPSLNSANYNNRSSATSSLGQRQHTPQLSPNSSISTVQENFSHRPNSSPPPPQAGATSQAPTPTNAMGQRASVGATIALMNSLAAAQSAAAAGLSSPIGQQQQQQVGALNGAISKQMMANSANRVRKPGPPKPPKPSIQQRSRFYQQQRQQQQLNGNNGLVMIGDSQMGTGQLTSADGNAAHLEADNLGETNDLAVEYSRLAFPARADL